MNKRIYFYNNYTSLDIPEKIDVYPTTVILGDTIDNIKSKMAECQLFCVLTHLNDADIVVQSESDKEILQSILNRASRKEKIVVKKDSIWYYNKAVKNIIISDTCKYQSGDINVILYNYLRSVSNLTNKIKPVEMYIVQNTRNSEILIKTPNMNEAQDVCDRHPCCVVKTRDDTIVYTTRFGKTSLKSSLRRSKAKNSKSNGIFKIKVY